MTKDYERRTYDALANPDTAEEQSISDLLRELDILARRNKDDYVLVKAVEHIGSAIIVLLDGPIGRLDQGTVDRMVRDTVKMAGGDSSEL